MHMGISASHPNVMRFQNKFGMTY